MTARKAKLLSAIEIFGLVAVPASLLCCAFLQVQATGLLTLVVTVLCLVVFFADFEAREVQLSQIMPVVVLTALAVAGRTIFSILPSIQPATAIVIIAGALFGRRSGFMVGALTALVSNMFLGMGPWTAWQMYAWGVLGYGAGVLEDKGAFRKTAVVLVYGFVGSLLFGFLMNLWMVMSFVQPFSWPAALTMFAAGAVTDGAHAVGTVVFLLALFTPWRKKLERIKRKYAQM